MLVCFFINFSFKPEAENNANSDSVLSKRANFGEVQSRCN